MDSDIDRVHRYCKDIANIINAVSFRVREINRKRLILKRTIISALRSSEYFHRIGRRSGVDGKRRN